MDQEYAELVEAVLGLDDHPAAQPHFRLYEKKKLVPAVSSPFHPPQVAQLYGFPTDVTGDGQTIGLIELGGGYKPSDLSAYFTTLGIVSPKVTAVSVDGRTNSPGDPNGPDLEVVLDIEVAGSIATGANIAVYFTPNSTRGFMDALTTALHDTANGPPSVVSISWGSAESNYSAQDLTAFDDACQSAAALGITITVASGDSGSSDGGSGNHVDFPASSPYVLACGGTALTASGSTISQEVVWNDQASGGGASGGGVSSFFELPIYQSNARVPTAPTAQGGRGVPDVAGDASPATGYTVSVDGQSGVVGGTSAVAPLWAALIALLNQRRGGNLGFLNSTLYVNAEAGFRDITEGSNGSYSAGTGWDPCTGLGSPDGAALSQIFASTVGGGDRFSFRSRVRTPGRRHDESPASRDHDRHRKRAAGNYRDRLARRHGGCFYRLRVRSTAWIASAGRQHNRSGQRTEHHCMVSSWPCWSVACDATNQSQSGRKPDRDSALGHRQFGAAPCSKFFSNNSHF